MPVRKLQGLKNLLKIVCYFCIIKKFELVTLIFYSIILTLIPLNIRSYQLYASLF